MADLPEQLNAYIDGITEAMSEAEVTAGRHWKLSRIPRRRIGAAVAAGAAVVLVPALVIAGLRLLPGDDPVAAPATSTTLTTTAPRETTTTVVANLVEVPDVVGLAAVDATGILTTAGFTVEATGDAHDLAVVSAPDPAPGTAVAAGTGVRIEVAADEPACRRGWAPPIPPPGPGEREVTILFDCADGADEPDVTTPVARLVPEQTDPIRAHSRRCSPARPTRSEPPACSRSSGRSRPVRWRRSSWRTVSSWWTSTTQST